MHIALFLFLYKSTLPFVNVTAIRKMFTNPFQISKSDFSCSSASNYWLLLLVVADRAYKWTDLPYEPFDLDQNELGAQYVSGFEFVPFCSSVQYGSNKILVSH